MTFLKTLLIGSLLVTTGALADDASALRDKLAGIDSLHTTFTQKVTDVNNKVIQSGSGLFALAYPNQFYWHLTEPDESLIVADGTNLWLYNPFAEEVTVMDISQAIEASPMALLVHRDDKTWAQYNVAQTSGNANNQCYQITPKGDQSSVVDVNVCFNQQTLTGFSLVDGQGNLSQFSLAEQREVKADETAIFTFVLPDNVDIDDQRLKQPQ
ncbi:outer membrane lipoprotein chaperone LolA [Shewanella intestini]|uniref:Outer-membrane lipoprotein carrier protein n=2 Tax=Shewanellaceae TaxID=267890 RepID=A0ABS5HZY3_9GAMM|nr:MULTISPECIES: outer membrane lipoprotein chaperone LolA [Shewanella]MBR9727143.1 outer membrane lipoprotein chaperone LolA [Shewanella intestini]MRG35945.1 outer membrane lipoprotein chaperone LolA [Shewanella sp. XMDDZSB0408]